MNKHAGSGTIYLLELIFSILFFAISAAVCLNIFALAHTMSKESVDLQRAVSVVSDACEAVSTAQSEEEAMQRLSLLWSFKDGNTVYLSADLKNTTPEEADYILIADVNRTDEMLTANFGFYRNGAEDDIYSQQTKVNIKAAR